MNSCEAPDRVAVFVADELRGVGVVRGENIFPLKRYSDKVHNEQLAVDRFFLDWDAAEVDWTTEDSSAPISGVTLQAPVRKSGKILCQVVNYAEHGEEASIAPPSRPFFFLRPQTSVLGPFHEIQAHHQSRAIDFEAEFAVVIGRTGRNIHVERSLDHVGALMVANDVSYRDLQFNRGHEDLNRRFGRNWTHGKGLDGSCALGPWLSIMRSPDDITRPRRIECRVNDELRQSATTEEMIFGVAQLISAASQGMTLECGDVILTGTPAGVGLADDRFLSPGDVVRTSIEGLGSLENTVQAVHS